MPSTDFKGGCFVARFEHLADLGSIIDHQHGTRLLLPFSRI